MRRGRIALPIVAGSLIAAGMVLPSPVLAEGIGWAPPSQVSAPAEDARESLLVTSPDGLAEIYTAGSDLKVRRHTTSGWGPTTVVQAGQLDYDIVEPVVAASATRTFVLSQQFNSAFDLLIKTTTLDAAGTVLGSSTVTNVETPTLAALSDGSAIAASISNDGSTVQVSTISSSGVVSSPTTLATPVNGSYYAVALVDKDGQPVVVWDECSDDLCNTSALLARTFINGSWSAPDTIATGVDDLGLVGTSGGGKMMLTYVEGSIDEFNAAGKAIVNTGGVWGAVSSTPTPGDPLIAPDGREVITNRLGEVFSRMGDTAPWTGTPNAPTSDDRCDFGGLPALEAGTLVIHPSVPNPLKAGGCKLMESRNDLATPPAVTDSTAPMVSITGGPTGFTNASGATVTFTASDSASDVATACRLNGVPVACNNGEVVLTNLASRTHTFDVASKDASGNWSTAVRTWVTDRVGPSAGLSTPNFTAILNGVVNVVWNGSDGGGSGIQFYDIQGNRAAANGGFTPWTTLQRTSVRSMNALISVGNTNCYRVRGIDRLGNIGAWSSQRCAIAPVDDRALATVGSWTRPASSSAYRSTLTITTVPGAQLRTGALPTTRLALVATKCSTCGTVQVFIGGTLLANVNLAATTTSFRNVINLPRFSLRSTTVTIKGTSSGKKVWIDGLLTSRV